MRLLQGTTKKARRLFKWGNWAPDVCAMGYNSGENMILEEIFKKQGRIWEKLKENW